MSYSWTADAALRRRREGSVSDVLDDGLSVVAAASRWNVRLDELERWLAEARGERAAEG